MSYFCITSGEDGIDIVQLTADEIKRRITPDEDGEMYYGGVPYFCTTIPKIDKGCFMADVNVMLIIKGEIVTPKAVATVTKYEL